MHPSLSATDRSSPIEIDARGHGRIPSAGRRSRNSGEYLLARDMGSILSQKEPSDEAGTIPKSTVPWFSEVSYVRRTDLTHSPVVEIVSHSQSWLNNSVIDDSYQIRRCVIDQFRQHPIKLALQVA
jgi:hypothetical protein